MRTKLLLEEISKTQYDQLIGLVNTYPNESRDAGNGARYGNYLHIGGTPNFEKDKESNFVVKSVSDVIIDIYPGFCIPSGSNPDGDFRESYKLTQANDMESIKTDVLKLIKDWI